jgi:cysteine desulfurase/selenocysteine lyase
VNDVCPPASVALAATNFGAFDGRIWLNTAHQGPLPLSAVAAAVAAAELKAAPYRITDESFEEVPERLRGLLAELVGATTDQIVLGNSTSYGLHLIANGLSWHEGDEVLVVAGDYPATVLPWLRLRERGVTVRSLHAASGLLTGEDLADALTERTRVLAVTWVDSFTGRTLDLDALGRVCRRAGVLLVVNASQALGARPLNVAHSPIDAVVACGYKWLCGPYGTGFTWLHPNLVDQLQPQQAYWLAMQAGRSLDQMRETTLRHDLGVRAFDVFCPANFLDVLAWIASLQMILNAGVDAVAAWDQQLVERLVVGLDTDRYRLISPASGRSRSTLVVVEETNGGTQDRVERLTDCGIDSAYREGRLRLAPHLFNTPEQIDQTIEALHTH